MCVEQATSAWRRVLQKLERYLLKAPFCTKSRTVRRDPRRGGLSGRRASQSRSDDCQPIALCGGDQPIESWTDADGHPLETQPADIPVAIVVHGERVCRSSAEHYREW